MGAFTEKQKQLLDETFEKWGALKSVINKYPKGYKFRYDKKKKEYVMTINLDHTVLLLED